jgi:pyruvate ferredoxin oxidoreductase gamma subunit
MGDAIEIRFHGRGGQGTVTLAALTVNAAHRSGWYALGFPSFGPERTGAPVAAFVRLDRAPVLDRSEVGTPNVVVIQDVGLVGVVDVLDGFRPEGTVIVNTPSVPDGLAAASHAIAVPASELAVAHLGSPITSTAMLGFLAAVTGLVDLDAAILAVRDRFGGEIAERNEALTRAAYAEGRRLQVAAA